MAFVQGSMLFLVQEQSVIPRRRRHELDRGLASDELLAVSLVGGVAAEFGRRGLADEPAGIGSSKQPCILFLCPFGQRPFGTAFSGAPERQFLDLAFVVSETFAQPYPIIRCNCTAVLW